MYNIDIMVLKDFLDVKFPPFFILIFFLFFAHAVWHAELLQSGIEHMPPALEAWRPPDHDGSPVLLILKGAVQ